LTIVGNFTEEGGGMIPDCLFRSINIAALNRSHLKDLVAIPGVARNPEYVKRIFDTVLGQRRFLEEGIQGENNILGW
jgi:hypothetical protein